jgi:UDP-N-acetylmuramoylalanine--D-glutamate ligase
MTLADPSELGRREVVILGFGREGSATLGFLRRRFPHKVFGIADQRPVDALGEEERGLIEAAAPLRLHLGPSYLECLGDYDVIIKAPGITPAKEEVRRARDEGRALTSHTEIFFALCDRTIVGVTGTKGKSTTSALIHAILERGGRESYLVGNFGEPPLPLLASSSKDAIFVCELSSYQLEGLDRSPPIAVLLNVFTEHTDYHGSHDAYVAAKANIARHQGEADWLVYRADDPQAARVAASSRSRKLGFSMHRTAAPALFIEGETVVFADAQGERALLPTAEIPLLGDFNRYNVMAALAVAHLLDVPATVASDAIRGFQALEHRLEVVGTLRGITFVNASIATVPEATLSHIEVFPASLKTLLLGGHDRGQDFSVLCDRLLERGVEVVILFPPAGERLWETLKARAGERPMPRPYFTRTMEEAVRLAYAQTPPGGICLHSPACASYGLFTDYRDRGNQFKRYVKELGAS